MKNSLLNVTSGAESKDMDFVLKSIMSVFCLLNITWKTVFTKLYCKLSKGHKSNIVLVKLLL